MRITLYGALPEHGAPNSRHPQHRKVIPMRATHLMAVAAALLFSTNLAFAQAQPQQRPTGAAAPPAAPWAPAPRFFFSPPNPPPPRAPPPPPPAGPPPPPRRPRAGFPTRRAR